MSIMVKFSSTTQQKRRLPEQTDKININATLNITKKKTWSGLYPSSDGLHDPPLKELTETLN